MSQGQGQGQGGGSHSLAFRVMRLCRPSFNVDPPLRLDPTDLFVGEDLFDDPSAAPAPSLSAEANDNSDPNYRNRFLLHHFSDAMGLSGLLVLPQSFGYTSLSLCFSSIQFDPFIMAHSYSQFAEPFIWGRLSAATSVLTTAPILKSEKSLSRSSFYISNSSTSLIFMNQFVTP